jgi:hypothetical protein
MKSKVACIISSALLLGCLNATNTYAIEKPVIEFFLASQTDLDLTSPNLNINFEVGVSHPEGIENKYTTLTITNSGTHSVSTQLKRADEPIDFSNKKVTFRGNVLIPRGFKPGVYTYSIDGVTSGAEKINTSNNIGFIRVDSGVITGPVLRSIKSAESGILVRNGGYLDLNYPTINGPAYGPQSGLTYVNSSKFSNVTAPIWKVNEEIDLSNYFELAVTGMELIVVTTNPKICKAEGTLLKLLAIGDCSFSVSTPRTRDYQAKSIYQSQAVADARKPTTLFVEKVANQQVKNLPITLELPKVYSSGLSAVEHVIPKSITPDICEAGGYILKIVSGGTCLITYKSLGNLSHLPSEIYTQSILIEKQSQTISFQTIQNIDVKSKMLDLVATASGKVPISFSTTSAGICSIAGSTLRLIKAGNCSVTATAAGTTIFSPVSVTVDILLTGAAVVPKKTITCTKGKSAKRVTGINPKCPSGYKIRK